LAPSLARPAPDAGVAAELWPAEADDEAPALPELGPEPAEDDDPAWPPTEGVLTDGADGAFGAGGVTVTDGVVTVGVFTGGVVTGGVVTVGVGAGVGVVTGGTVTVGTVTEGTVVDGTVGDGVCALAGRPLSARDETTIVAPNHARREGMRTPKYLLGGSRSRSARS
jgi:hypothetical protein